MLFQERTLHPPTSFKSFSTSKSRSILRTYKKEESPTNRPRPRQDEISQDDSREQLIILKHAIENKDFAQAYTIASTINESDPGCIPFTLAFLTIQQQHNDSQLETLIDQAIQLDPMRSEAYLLRTVHILQSNTNSDSDRHTARKNIESTLKLLPSGDSSLFELWRLGAILSWQILDWPATIRWSEMAIQIAQSSKKNNLSSTNELSKIDQHTIQATDHLTLLIEKNSFNVYDVLYDIIPLISPKIQGQSEHSISQQNLSLAELFFYRADALLHMNQHNEARMNFEMVLKLNPHFADTYHSYAIQFDNEEKFEQAIAKYDILLKLEPTRFDYLVQTAHTLEKLVISKQSHDSTQPSPTLSSKDTLDSDSELIGWIKRAAQHYDKALKHASTVDSLNGLSLDQAYVSRGQLLNKYFDKKFQTEALSDFTTAIQINENSVNAYRERAQLFINRNMPLDAIKDYEVWDQLISEKSDDAFSTDNASIYMFMALYYYDTSHDYEKSRHYFIKAFRCQYFSKETPQVDINRILYAITRQFVKEHALTAESTELPSPSLVQLCLERMNLPLKGQFGPFSRELHRFHNLFSREFYNRFSELKQELNDPKKKKKK